MRGILFAAGMGLVLGAAGAAKAAVVKTNTPTEAATTTATVPAVSFLPPGSTRLGGLLGQRHDANVSGRLTAISEDDLLAGFRNRPGKQAWIGEHVGKWLHAASLSWLNTGNPQLLEKLDRVATGLMETQEKSGYLGTYAPDRRFNKIDPDFWDVWVHKYAMLGLLAYSDATGSTAALEAASRAGSHVADVVGRGGRDVNEISLHVGMASTSAIEPLIILYRHTGSRRYLDLALEFVAAWDKPNGAGIISRLLQDKTVLTVGNRKAYEMLSCLKGLCELYRETGNEQYLQAALIAWEDVAKNHMYITGSGSVDERWTENRYHPLHPKDKICETCVTVTWMQLNGALFELTGRAQIMDEIEKSVYNHLLAAQHPDGSRFCYYTPLEGEKPYSQDMTCCFSSGSRGVAMLPSLVYSTSCRFPAGDRLQVNLYTESQTRLRLQSGREIVVTQHTDYPRSGRVTLEIDSGIGPHIFTVQLRVPDWAADETRWAVNGGESVLAEVEGGWLNIHRKWTPGDRLTLELPMALRTVEGYANTSDSLALAYGPLVLAADVSDNQPATSTTLNSLKIDSEALTQKAIPAGGEELQVTVAAQDHTDKQASLVVRPFYSAGAGGGYIKVWFQNSKKQQSE